MLYKKSACGCLATLKKDSKLILDAAVPNKLLQKESFLIFFATWIIENYTNFIFVLFIVWNLKYFHNVLLSIWRLVTIFIFMSKRSLKMEVENSSVAILCVKMQCNLCENLKCLLFDLEWVVMQGLKTFLVLFF